MANGNGKEWLTRKEATALLAELGHPMAPQTLANLAANGNKGKGPPFRRFRHKTVRYDRAALIAWAAKQTEDFA
jgi:hypothetical protein